MSDFMVYIPCLPTLQIIQNQSSLIQHQDSSFVTYLFTMKFITSVATILSLAVLGLATPIAEAEPEANPQDYGTYANYGSYGVTSTSTTTTPPTTTDYGSYGTYGAYADYGSYKEKKV